VVDAGAEDGEDYGRDSEQEQAADLAAAFEIGRSGHAWKVRSLQLTVVDFAAVANSCDGNQPLFVVDRVDHPVIADADAPKILAALEFL